MNMFILQTLLLIAIAFFLGCLIGYLLRLLFGAGAEQEGPEVETSVNEKHAKPVASKPEMAAAPVSFASSGATGTPDNLKEISGVGPVIEKKLNAIGITTFQQIADLTPAQVSEIGEKLVFSGRIERENWIEQARVLAAGGDTEFSKRVEKGEVDSSK